MAASLRPTRVLWPKGCSPTGRAEEVIGSLADFNGKRQRWHFLSKMPEQTADVIAYILGLRDPRCLSTGVPRLVVRQHRI